MTEVEKALQSKSSLQLYLFMNTHVSSQETPGALLGTHVTISVKANIQQSSSLPVFSPIDCHTRPLKELCKFVLFHQLASQPRIDGYLEFSQFYSTYKTRPLASHPYDRAQGLM